MDFIMEYEKAKQHVDEQGWDSFLGSFQDQYEDRGLYSVSMDWHESDEFICKFRGTDGDVIVGWEGIHDKPKKKRWF